MRTSDSLRPALYLKTLSLTGFKSFADRTRLEFGPGVNVVVGPNGAGKSNLVDAVAWAIGTQAASALRTHKMDEVIFSGTSVRPAHGRTEVTVTFDNASGTLPLDLPEVTVSRRLYRDGTSEYEINGTSCRLLDIQELLADSGVGRHQHVIVGQDRIGTILNARPEEHRAVIEEAAGVIKHRNRRDRASRRLEQTDLDVARLRDILTEQLRRMRPLKRQANAAERHDAVRDEARALRLYLGGEGLRAMDGRLVEADGELGILSTRMEEAQTELEQLRASLSGMEKAAGELGKALERDTTAAARLETATERLQRIGMVARERRMAVETRVRSAGDRRRALETEVEDLRRGLRSAINEERAASVQAEQREMTLQSLEEQERSLGEQAQLPTEGIVANLRGDLSALETAAQRDKRESDGVEKRLETVGAYLTEHRKESARLDVEIKQTDAELAVIQPEYEAARTDRDARQKDWESAQAAQGEATVVLAGAVARLEALEAAETGLIDPVARDRVAALPEIVGTLASRLDAPPDVATAVDSALGVWSQAYVADGADGIANIVASQKGDGGGGIPVVSMVAGGSLPARGIAKESGLDALIDRLGPAADTELAALLVGDVLVVEGWAAGWKLVTRHPEIRAVTPEGDLITAYGILPAVPDGAGAAALEAAGADREAAEISLARAQSRTTAGRRAFDQARNSERATLEAVEAVETRLGGAAEALRLIGQAKYQAEEEQKRLEDRLQALGAASKTREHRLVELRSRLAAFEGEEAVRLQAWEALNRRREQVIAQRDEARRAREEAAGALAAVEERRRLTEVRLSEVEHELGGVSPVIASPGTVDRLGAVEAAARRGLDIVRSHVGILRGRQRDIRAEAGSAGGALKGAHSRQRELDFEVSTGRERLSDLKIETAELRMRRESVAEGLRRDADAEEETALAAPQPELADGIDPLQYLAELDARLRRMGPINPLAAAEHKELFERTEFLQVQIDDVEESRRELRKVISALDNQIAEDFKTAFAEIAAFYEENFKLLFPGGKGKLTIMDGDDILDTGVEIHAQPLGKKVSRLALLSGGERSLAALAFLFAVFRARPSPFYILDEVEAALDDANLRRFIRLVGTLRGSAQLAIITHQQHTMEAADILYGVTMEPGESSQVVAKRLADIHV